MIHLVEKEFKVNGNLISFRKDKIVSSLLTFLLGGIMVYVSTFMFTLLFRKFSTYSAELPFAIIYMFILSLVTLVFAIFTARKVFFNNQDYRVTVSRPIDTFVLIFAKVIYLLLVLFLFELVLLAPHYIAFGVMSGAMPSYYYVIIVSVIFHALFDLSIAMILIVGVEVVYRFLKRYLFLQIIIIILFAVGATFLYSYVLDLFLKLLSNSNVSYLFNDNNISRMKYLSTLLYPDVFISRSLFTSNFKQLVSYVLISIGIFMLATIFLYFLFIKVINLDFESKKKNKHKPFKEKGQTHAFFKKELMLLTRETSNLYNFTILIIIEPILTYLVIVGINQAFSGGLFSVYASVLPSLIKNIDILIILLFSSLIALSGANLIKSEHKSVRILKYLPYKVTTQVYIKMAILGLATLLTNVLSLSILLIFKEITFDTFIFLLLVSLILNSSLIVLSFRSEIINFRKASNENALASLIAFVVPIIIIGVNLLSSLLLDLKDIFAYLINFAFLAFLLLLVFIYLRRGFKKDIDNLEVIN